MCYEYNEALGASEQPWEDPIVAEIHAARERLFEEAGGSAEGLLALLKASEAARGVTSVSRPPKRPESIGTNQPDRSGEAA